jgi:crotonobetainyl-CoA:carnitine CoA-transferase CaiB-like acyl-CoA transferase
LCDGLGVPELKDTLHQPAHAESTTRLLAEILRTRPASDWVEALASKGAAVTILNHGAQLLQDPHIKARHSVVESAGVPVPANPVRISDPSGAQSETATNSPHKVGEDTGDVLASAGFSAAEIEAFVTAGLV